eukprot:CAMPEP_0174865038 /NCGR_PEP_ID=MMETSP1114-20130205/59608_1 /TAXON_ID=312471 /ORGANISM="Neobodo designis, Strain CCAP 1951/1" /LENGTH=64 /DNA_ID=CAMNT_0016100155 /DNA_START=143 /DNA_END=333 /DNA_ORIENTATION=+
MSSSPGRPSTASAGGGGGGKSTGSAESVKVAVRVRPFNEREKASSQVPVLRMAPSAGQVTIRAA